MKDRDGKLSRGGIVVDFMVHRKVREFVRVATIEQFKKNKGGSVFRWFVDHGDGP